MKTRASLKAKLTTLLGEVLRKRDPSMMTLVASSQHVELTDEQRDELRQILTDEFIETGLREDDEPNERGLLLEELIDKFS